MLFRSLLSLNLENLQFLQINAYGDMIFSKSLIFKLSFDSFNNLLIDEYIVILYILSFNQQTVYISVLINSSVSRYKFIDHFYIHKYNIPIIFLNKSQTLEAFNSKSTKYRKLIDIAQINCLLFNIYKKYNFYLYISYFYYHFIVLGNYQL